MDLDWHWIRFCGAMFITAAAIWVLRAACLIAMKTSTGRNSLAPNSPGNDELKVLPVELAYLLRPGDSAHCLSVIVVDLLQKGLKSPAGLAEEISQRHYEVEIGNAVKAYIRDWTAQKVQTLVPKLLTKSHIKITTGFWRLRDWIIETFKGLWSDLIKDPLSIRHYFHPVGLLRISVALLRSSVMDPFMRSLRSSLLERELLVPESRRQVFSRILRVIAIAQSLALIVLFAYVSGVKRWEVLIALAFCTAFNGFILRLLAAVPSFLPFYEELSLVLESIGRSGFRVSLLKGLLKFIRSLFWFLVSIMALSCYALQAFAFAQFCHLASGSWLMDLIGLIAITVNFVLIADLFMLSAQIANTDQVSLSGEAVLKQERLKVKGVSPISAFSKVLSDPEYNEQMSEIVAIYGIETLFLLA